MTGVIYYEQVVGIIVLVHPAIYFKLKLDLRVLLF
jgi:hypothetical protein